jgi:hypothetical protein
MDKSDHDRQRVGNGPEASRPLPPPPPPPSYGRSRGRPTHGSRGADIPCMCRSPESQGFIYPPPHCVRFQPRSRQSLLGSPAHLCAGYFHTDRCFEAESADEASGTFCLAPPPPPPERFLNAPLVCERKPNTILMLRVQSAAEEMYLCRYTNCFRGYANSLHAEQFMMEDPELLRLLRAQVLRGH